VTAGVVVAGGRSTRFGDREKALVRVGGEPMLRRVVERLGHVADRLVINCRADQRAPFGDALAPAAPPAPVSFAVDDPASEDEGPLAGLRRALAAVDDPYAAVVACDLPFLEPEALAALRTRAVQGDADAAVPVDGSGRPEPLHAVYATGATERAAGRLLAEGTRRVGLLVDRLDDVDPVPEASLPGSARSVRSVDDPRALAAARDGPPVSGSGRRRSGADARPPSAHGPNSRP
jgi:molybdopterin-guanine dinucleotide biosynthesis protein A